MHTTTRSGPPHHFGVSLPDSWAALLVVLPGTERRGARTKAVECQGLNPGLPSGGTAVLRGAGERDIQLLSKFMLTRVIVSSVSFQGHEISIGAIGIYGGPARVIASTWAPFGVP